MINKKIRPSIKEKNFIFNVTDCGVSLMLSDCSGGIMNYVNH